MRYTLLTIALLLSTSFQAQTFETWHDTPSEIGGGSRFGMQSTSEGEWAFMTSSSSSGNGSLGIYRHVNDAWQIWDWKYQAYGFGESIDVDNGILVLGAADVDPGEMQFGEVFIYKLIGTSWIESAVITAADVTGDCFIGRSVAIDNGRVAIGTSNCDEREIYIYTEDIDGWELEATITAPDTTAVNFGARIELENDVLIVSDIGYESSTGAFYLYMDGDDGWEFKQFFTAPDTVGQVTAGYNIIDYDDGTLVFGGKAQDGNFSNESMGKAYAMELQDDSLVFTQTFLPIDSMDNCRFGASIDLRGDELLIGAIRNPNVDGVETGNVHHYQRLNGQWELADRLWPSNGIDQDIFGASCTLTDQGDVFVGAWGANGDGNNSGAIYFFDDIFTGLWEPLAELPISVFPNPSSGKF